MNRFCCEKETEILEALRRGPLHAELAEHAASCDICVDTLAVSEFLLADRSVFLAQLCHSEPSEEPRLGLYPSTVDKNTQLRTPLPDSDFLWWKAQLARKQMAVERATRSIALVRRVSYLGAAVAGLWLVFAPGPLASMLSLLSKRGIWPAGALTQSALFLGVTALAFTLFGSLYLSRSEK